MNPKLISFIVLLFGILVNYNCYHNRVTFNPNGTPGPRQTIMNPYFLWGLLPGKRYNSTQFCGKKGIYQVHAYTSFVDGLLSCITSGIYSPRSLEIICDNSDLSYKLQRIEGGDNEIYYQVYATKPEIPKNISYLLIKEER